MRILLAIGAVLIVVVGACGGRGYGDGSDTMSMTRPSSADAAVVTIVGQKGMLSFDPNPAPVAPGASVVWRNTDAATHRIVMNDGSFDSGDIVPGGSSPAMRRGPLGGDYHCIIHPTMMFGTIN